MRGQGVSRARPASAKAGAGGPRIVAHTLSYLPWRRIGAELATHGLLSVLAASGWRVILAPHDTKAVGWPTTVVDGVHVVPPELADRSRPDVVLAHAGFYTRAREHADRFGAPLVLYGHGGYPGWLAAQCDGAQAQLLLANSETMAYGLQRTGIPVQLCRPAVWPPERFGRSAPIGDAVTLVNATPGKGSDVLVDLAQVMPHRRFVAVRGGYGEQADLSALSNVEVLPHGTPMDQVWGKTRVLIVPSREESWGMAAVEAMGHGIPVVGSAIPGLSEALGTGLPTVEPRNTAGWRTTVSDALGPMWERWHRAALRRAAELDPARDLLATVAAIEALIGEGPMVTKQRYRNVRTGDEVDVDPDSFIGRRVTAEPLIWHRVEEPAGAAPDAPAGPVGPEGVTPLPEGPAVLSADPGLHIPDAMPQPAPGAHREAWVEYAVSRGCDRAAAGRATRSALIALYADPGR